jgi:hypothetical protein
MCKSSRRRATRGSSLVPICETLCLLEAVCMSEAHVGCLLRGTLLSRALGLHVLVYLLGLDTLL